MAAASPQAHTVAEASAAPAAASSVDVGAASASTSAAPDPSAPVVPEIARPAYFFPLNNNPIKSQEIEPEPIPDDVFLHPDDDPGASRGIPVFKPSFDDFKQFDAYMEKVVPWGMRSGIVKIVPPKEWVDAVKLIDNRALSELQIRSPIEQRMMGQNGVFVQRNVERMRNRPLSIHEWYDKCNIPDFKTPNPKEMDRSVDRDSKDAKMWQRERAAQVKAEKQAKREKREAALKRKKERERRAKESAPSASDKPSGPKDASSFDAQASAAATPDDLPSLEACSHTSHSDGEPLATTPEAPPIPASSSSGRTPDKARKEEARDDDDDIDSFYETADFKKDWLPPGATAEDFTVTNCSNIERKFWKTIGMGRSSWYGADLAGSLFADPETPWNVATLPNLLQKMKNKLPGVNTPYLYFGMWRAAFSWHVEDMDLFSINYIHFGAPKFWYAVPQADAERFETVTRSYFPNDANTCDQFMRHKSCTLSPTKLNKEGIRVNKLVHHQNEFVVTFPRGYHSGFNMGFNCAESANFALPCWLDIGKRAKACTCVNFSVRIDVDQLMDPTDEEEEEEPSGDEEVKPKRTPRKRRSDEHGTPASARKRRRRDEEESAEPTVKVEEPSEGTAPLKIKIPVVRIKKPPTEVVSLTPKDKAQSTVKRPLPQSPCVLCPSLATEDLARVFEPSDHIKALSKTPEAMAHISCAIAVPEAYTEEVDSGDGQKVIYVKGLDNIAKARWKLKCASCVDQRTAKMGTKIQCTKGKCLRAYHVSCARDNPQVDYWAGDKLVDGQPTFAVELLCPTHNPAVLEMKKRKAEEELKAKVLALPTGSVLKFKRNGSSYEATLLETLEATSKVLVQLTDGSRREVSWTALNFNAHQPRMMENEYAGPPKRSRKEQPAEPSGGQAAPAPPANVVTQPNTKPPPHAPPQHAPPQHAPPQHAPPQHAPPAQTHPRQASYIPSDPGRYYQPGPMYPPSTSVVLVDSKMGHMPVHGRAHMPPPHYAEGPPPLGGYTRGPMAMDHARGMPPPLSYGPRVPMPPQRAIVQGYHARPPYPVAAPPPRHMMAPMGQQPPPPQQANGWHPGYPQHSRPPPPGQSPTAPPPSVPGGVGKIDLGLDRMRSLMGGLPPLAVPAIHLAGTNGKGSVSVVLESCLREAGFRTARYNSPHLLEPRDAIRIDGMPPPAAHYAQALAQVQRVSDERGLKATTFEIGTAAAFLIANTAQPPVDVMIVECGMGGARDATNIMPPGLVLASGLTSVGLDHTDQLGKTIGAIAREKAAIAVPGGVLVAAPHLHPEALPAAQLVASEHRAHFVQAQPSSVVAPSTAVSLVPFREPTPPLVRTPLAGTAAKHLDTRLALGGAHQLDNLSLALTLLDVIRHDKRAVGIQPKLAGVNEAHMQAGVASARWEGRCSWLQWHDVPFLVDGAHNLDSAATLRHYIDGLGVPPDRPRTYVLALSANPAKTPDSVLAPLLRAGDRVALVDFSSPVEGMPWIRPADKAAVRAAAERLIGPHGVVHDSPGAGPAAIADALRWAAADWNARGPGLVTVCGSLYLVADAYRLLQRG